MAKRDASAVDELVAQKIRSYRIRRGLTQTALANVLGVTFQQVQKYEKGVNRVGAGRLFEIARHFGIQIQDLFPEPTAPSSNSAGGAPHLAELEALVASMDTLHLIRAFQAVTDTRQRKRILALVQELVKDGKETNDPLANRTDF